MFSKISPNSLENTCEKPFLLKFSSCCFCKAWKNQWLMKYFYPITSHNDTLPLKEHAPGKISQNDLGNIFRKLFFNKAKDLNLFKKKSLLHEYFPRYFLEKLLEKIILKSSCFRKSLIDLGGNICLINIFCLSNCSCWY